MAANNFLKGENSFLLSSRGEKKHLQHLQLLQKKMINARQMPKREGEARLELTDNDEGI